MPKIIPPLTNTAIKNAKQGGKLTTLFDGAETGLHLLIQPTGTKTFRLKATINGKDKRITIGHFPDISLADAREKAAELKKQIRLGNDPTAAPPAATSFAFVSERFVEWKSSVLLRSGSTIRKYRECLNNDLLAAIGNKDIASIHAAEIVPLLEQVNRRSNSLARKNAELISMIVKYAVQRGYRPPYTQLDLSGVIARNPSAPKTIPSDIQSTFAKIDKYPEPLMRNAMKLQFLCFLRASETMGAEWSEIDIKKAEWHVPAHRMKMNRPHVVPLAKQTVELLKELKKLTGESPYLFPSSHNDSPMVRDSLSKAFRSINLGIVPHGCRTAAGTWARNNGVAPHVVESQLSHVEANQIAAAYQDKPHLMYMKERKEMMQAWADHIRNTTKTKHSNT